MVKKSLTKRNLVKKTKRKSFRRAGANTPSPIRRKNRTPKAIQRDSTDFKSLIGQVAAKYETELDKLDTKDLDLTGIKLSFKPLQGIDLRGANLTQAKLNGTKLNGAKLNGANFTRAELKKTILINADLTNANFDAATLDSTDFTGANLTEAIFLNITVSKANLPIFKNTNLTKATLDRLEYISKNNGNILTKLTIKGIIKEYDLRLEDIELQNSTLIDVELTMSKLKRVNFSGSTMSKMTLGHSTISDCSFQNSTLIDVKLIAPNLEGVNFSGSTMNNILFDRCTINRCSFQDITSNLLKFNHCVIDNCNFSNAKLVGVEFISCTFTNPIWTNADLTNTLFTGSPLKGLNFEGTTLVNADFRYQNLSGTNFRNAKLTQAHFNSLSVNGLTKPVTFDITTNFQGATLISANFQQAIGLERHNFNGVIMNGALFIGCDLTESTFRDANVGYVQFGYSNLTDCDFTDARIDNVQYDDSTIGVVSTVGLVRGVRQEQIPQEIHKAWSHVLKNETYNFLKNKVTTKPPKPTTAKDMAEYINNTLQDLITNSVEEKKKELTKQLQECKASYESYDFMKILDATNPPRTYGDLAFATLEYVKSERDEFKNIYLEELLGENVSAHGAGGKSCAQGMAERLIVKLIVPAQGMTTVAPEIRFHYHKLINLLEPLYKLPEDKAAETAKAAYVDVEIGAAFRDEWHDLHKVGSDGAFPENTNLSAILANYKAFLEEKFKDVVMSPDKRLELNSNIDRAIEEMQKVIEFYDTHEEYFKGGSSRRKKHNYTRIFSMNTREFRKLFAKSKKLTP